jgi:predicted Zn-dependent protease
VSKSKHRRNKTLAPAPSGTKSQADVNYTEMKRFLGAVVLLGIALLGFFALMLPFSKENSFNATPGEVDIIEQLAEGKRQMLREALRVETAHLRNQLESHPAKPRLKSLTVAKTGALPVTVVVKSVTDDQSDPEIQSAIKAIDAGNISEAIALLEAVLKRDPRNEQALVEMAMIYMLDLKQSAEAIGYLQRAMDVNPDNKVVMSELVSLYEEEGRVDEGLAFMMERANAHPESSELSYGIGQMLSLQGREADAIPYLERAVKGAENPVRAYRDLAEAYARNGEASRAVDSYSKAITEQEKEIVEKAQAGMPTAFAEERLSNTKLDKARILIQAGDDASLDAAERILDDVSSRMPDLEQAAALKQTLAKKRAG